jgi:hypothetical protein
VDTSGTGVNGAALKEAIRRAQIVTVHRGTDGTHPTLVVEKVENPADAGSSLTLDALRDVTAPASTPAGKVLGTTATGVWGPVDAAGGGGGGGTSVTPNVKPRPGLWYTGTDRPLAADKSITTELLCHPIMFNHDVTIDRIGMYVSTAGAASATLRMGIYNSRADGLPGTVLLDAGTVETGTTSGQKLITVSQALRAGVVYWLAYSCSAADVKGWGSAETPNSGYDLGRVEGKWDAVVSCVYYPHTGGAPFGDLTNSGAPGEPVTPYARPVVRIA